MSQKLQEMQEVIEAIEHERLTKELSLQEEKEGIVHMQSTLMGRTKYLDFLGALALGLSIGIFTLIFNYIVFVWFLHLEF